MAQSTPFPSVSDYVVIDRAHSNHQQNSAGHSPLNIIHSPEDPRWSEVIPSDTGISFAVAWDPVEDAAVFSGARLVQSATGREDPISPTDIVDTHSQVLTIGPSSILVSENTGTLGYFRDQQDLFFSAKTPQFDKRMAQEQARSSSTRSGIDVYLRGSVLGNGRRQRRRKASGGDGLDMDFQQDPITSFVRLCLRYADGEIEQPHTEDGPSRRPSRPPHQSVLSSPSSEPSYSNVSGETISTWSAFEIPSVHGAIQTMWPHTQRRRLQKRPPPQSHFRHGNAPPLPPTVTEAESHPRLQPQLQGPQHTEHRTHHTVLSEESLQRSSFRLPRCGLPKLPVGLWKWGRYGDDEAWVWVEIAQEVYLESEQSSVSM